MGLICTERNLWRWFEEQSAAQDPLPFHKSTVYALLKNPHVNWQRLLLALSAATTRWVRALSSRDAVFIVGESLFDRQRSRKVDFLSKVYDHVEHRYRWGFRWLVLGWSDGTTFLPIHFSLLGSRKAALRRQTAPSPIDGRTVGAKRRQEALESAPTMVIKSLQAALQSGIRARYVLFDRWFTTPRLIGQIVATTRLAVIGMVKASPNIYYHYQGQRYSLNQLYRVARRGWHRNTAYGSIVAILPTDSGMLRVRLVFVRDRRPHSKAWLALLTTDVSLSDDEVIRIYGKRWAIETFFKTAKSLLGIPREYQGRSYEGCVAHVTLVCIRYQWLAIEARKEEDIRTLGELFYVQCQELEDIAFAWVWEQIVAAFKATLSEDLDLTEEQIDQLFHRFLERIPETIRHRITRFASIGLLKAG